jgi:hypothetical protein
MRVRRRWAARFPLEATVMSPLRLILKELRHRRANFALSLTGLAATVALFVAFFTTAEAAKRETIRVTRDMGFNLRIIPRDKPLPAQLPEDPVSYQSWDSTCASSRATNPSRPNPLKIQFPTNSFLPITLPNDARPVTAYLFSRGPAGDHAAPGDHLGIGGTHGKNMGQLFFYNGNQRGQVVSGANRVPVGAWNHVVFARAGKRVTAFLNGASKPAFEGEADVTTAGANTFFVGARSDHFAPLDGQIAEFALFDRALDAGAAAQLFRAAKGVPQ